MSQGFKMLSWVIGITLIATLELEVHGQNKIPPPPTVQGSYKAIGEVLQSDMGRMIQAVFEEDYDNETKMSSFVLRMAGLNATFIEDYKSNVTVLYIDDKVCEVVTKQEWLEIDAPPSLLGYEVKNGHIQFALQQLLNIDSKYLKDYNPNDTFRGVPARSWVYEMKNEERGDTVAIYAYWTLPTWETTSSENEIPLGYEINNITKGEGIISVNYISVFGFIHNSVNKRVFEPKSGVFCPNRTGIQKFPFLPRYAAVSLHSEFTLPDEQDFRNFDVWYDMSHALLRVDMDRVDGQEPIYMKQGRKITSEITSKFLSSTFMITIYGGRFSCDVIPLNNYKFEVQHLINPKLDNKKWNADYFFGKNTTDYVYIGKTTKRNIPCHVFQGIRKDWPEESADVSSLWEWCLAASFSDADEKVEFREGELPLLNAQVYIMESGNDDFPVGFRMIHHFYDIMLEDPEVLSNSAYDVSRCFQVNEKKALQFAVDLKIDNNNLVMIRNATSNPNFLYAWKNQIADNSGMRIDELRITKMKSTVYENVLYVMFTLLEVHPKIPDDIRKTLTSMNDANAKFEKAVNDGKISISFPLTKDKKMTVLKVKPNSLTPQVDPTKFVNVSTETPSLTSSTLTPISTINFTIWTPPIRTDGESTPSVKPTGDITIHPTTNITIQPTIGDKEEKSVGASSGTVAAVTVVMLIVGVTLGSGGTFYKLRGLPTWLRRRGQVPLWCHALKRF